MKLLKGITAGVLCLTLLSAPGVDLPLLGDSSQAEASVQTKAMYPNKKTVAYQSKSSKSSRVMTIPYGVRVDRLAVASSWSQVRYNGKVGWVASRDLVEIKKTEVLDTKQTVTMYVSRSTKAKRLTKIPVNKQVTRLAVNQSWSQVKYGNHTGWVASSQLKIRYTRETFALTKYRVKEVAPLQSSYSTSSNVIATLPDFGVVESVERYNNWYKVTFANQTGWVQGKYLTTYKAETPRETVHRILGDKYEITDYKYPFYGTRKEVSDGYWANFYFSETHMDFDYVPQEDYLMFAKLITTIKGGDANKLVEIMKEVEKTDIDSYYGDLYIAYTDSGLLISWNN